MIHSQVRAIVNDNGVYDQRTPGPDDDDPIYDNKWEQLDMLEKGLQSLHTPNLYL